MNTEDFKHTCIVKSEAQCKLEEIAFTNIVEVASQYVEAHGKESGLSKLAEHLCCRIAPSVDEQAWNRILHHVKKISG